MDTTGVFLAEEQVRRDNNIADVALCDQARCVASHNSTICQAEPRFLPEHSLVSSPTLHVLTQAALQLHQFC